MPSYPPDYIQVTMHGGVDTVEGSDYIEGVPGMNPVSEYEMSSVCLTEKQKKFYNYFINYYKSNGCFPNPTETGRDMNCSSPNAANMYGVLLLKGCFTNGQPLTNTYKARHNATPIQPVNIANFKMEAKAKKKEAAKKSLNKRQIASLLVKLLSEDKIDTKAIAELIA